MNEMHVGDVIEWLRKTSAELSATADKLERWSDDPPVPPLVVADPDIPCTGSEYTAPPTT